jgi:hypothetical protein
MEDGTWLVTAKGKKRVTRPDSMQGRVDTSDQVQIGHLRVSEQMRHTFLLLPSSFSLLPSYFVRRGACRVRPGSNIMGKALSPKAPALVPLLNAHVATKKHCQVDVGSSIADVEPFRLRRVGS